MSPFFLPMSLYHKMPDILRLSSALFRHYPKARFFGLGQSPAWIIQALDLSARWRGKTVETGMIPFSRCFFFDRHLLSTMSDDVRRHFDFTPMLDKHMPTSRKRKKGLDKKTAFLNLPNVRNYLRVLKRLGADPATVVKKYQETGTPTVLADLYAEGKGMASHLFLTSLEAERNGLWPAYKQALQVQLYSYHTKNDLFFDVDKDKGFPVQMSKISEELCNMLWDGPEAERLTAHYDYPSWHDPYPMADGDPDEIVMLFKTLEEVIAETWPKKEQKAKKPEAAPSRRPSREARL